MNPPKISVVIPLYNQGVYLPDCLRSLQAQTYPHWQAIVVDDGSTDDSGVTAERLARDEPRVSVHRKRNGGLSSARNHGLDHATGEFIQFLDADDLLLPRKFELQLGQLRERPKNSLSLSGFRYGRCGRLDESPLEPLPLGLDAGTPLSQFIADWEFKASIPCHSFLFSADLFSRSSLRFNPDLPNHEDFECWVRVLHRQPAVFVLPEVLAIYRYRDTSMSRDLGKMRSGFNKALEALQRRKEFPAEVRTALKLKQRTMNREYDRHMRIPIVKGVAFRRFPQLGRLIKGVYRRLPFTLSRSAAG